MQLLDAIDLKRGEMACFVGAGGKTSLMLRLASECLARNRRVLVTTSTRMLDWQLQGCGELILDADEDRLFGKLTAAGGSLAVAAGAGLTDGGKVVGLSKEFLNAVSSAGLFDNVLVEADGARGRPLKAPASHEPAVPARAGCVLAVTGAEVLGFPLTEQYVHRSRLAAAIAGQDAGSTITGSTVSKLISYYRDVVRQISPVSRFIPVINKADGEALLNKAREVAGRLLPSPGRILIASALQADPVLEVAP